MKRNVLISIFSILVVSLLVSACEKPGDIRHSKKEVSSLQLKNVGDYHNDVAKYIVDNIKFLENSSDLDFKFILLKGAKNLSKHFGIEENELRQIIQNINFRRIRDKIVSDESKWKRYVNESQMSEEMVRMIYSFSHYLNEIELTDVYNDNPRNIVKTIQVKVEKFYDVNGDLLDPNDKDLLGSFIRVAKSSTRMWFPVEFGGLGYNQKLSMNLYGAKPALRKNWFTKWVESKAFGKFIITDAAGMVAGATTAVIASGGAAAIPNPALGGIPTASVVGVVQGASNSVMSQL